MLARKSIPMLAAAVTLLGGGTPAYAFDSEAPAGGTVPSAHVTVSHRSSDLALELAAGGIVVIGGGGLAAWQLHRRPTRAVHKARATSGS